MLLGVLPDSNNFNFVFHIMKEVKTSQLFNTIN